LQSFKLAGEEDTAKTANERLSCVWTEHSSRPTLPSWARAVGVPKEITDRLGWWSSRSAARVQSCVATFLRAALAAQTVGSPFCDQFDDESVIEKLKEFNAKSSPDHDKFTAFGLRTFARASKTKPVDVIKRFGWSFCDEVPLDALPEAAVSTESEKEEAGDIKPPLPTLNSWVVTSSKGGNKGAKGCLHVIGRCYRVPGIHYLRWRGVADNATASEFAKACKQCFPFGYPEHDGRPPECIEASLHPDMPKEVADEEFSSEDSV
jgi:hypothetical protein